MSGIRIMRIIIIATIIIVLNVIPVGAQIVDEPVSPQEYQTMLGAGMDVDWAKTKQGMTYYNEQVVKDFAKKGVKHVRIRVADNVSEELLSHLEKVVNDCLSNDIIPIVAYQADTFKNDPSAENMELVVQWWSAVAQRFKGYSHKLSFDLLIECTNQLNKEPDTLNEMFERVTGEIRKSNPDRIIIISPVVRSSPENLALLKIPTQHNDYIMAEWHFYAAGPSKTNETKLWTVGTDDEKKIILDKVAVALDWQEKNGIPTWVGAWMPGNYNDGNDYTVEEQIVFASFVRDTLNNAQIPFAVNSDTKFYDRQTNLWLEDMLPLMYVIYCEEQNIIYGDADADGMQTSNDCSYIMQKVLNSNYELPIEKNCAYLDVVDVDGDDILSAVDTAIVLQKILDSNFIMPVEKGELF